MPVKYFDPGSIEWLAARKGYVTGTEVAALLGLCPYGSFAKIKKGKLENIQVFDNAYMRAGRILEPAVLAACQEAGIPAEAAHATQTVFAYNDEYRLSSSLDGKANTEQGFYIVECKTTQPHKFPEWETNPPINYYAQVQAQMLMTGVEQAFLAGMSVEFPFPLIVWEVRKDERTQKAIIKAAAKFWDALENNKTFAVDKASRDDIKADYLKYCELIIN